MRLLLTSSGLTDPEIVRSLKDLAPRPIERAGIAFVPGHDPYRPGDKSWFVDDLHRFREMEPAGFDLVDLDLLDTSEVMSRLMAADIVVFGGGDTYHLMDNVERHGLTTTLRPLLEQRLYVGISAGSIITNPCIGMGSDSSWWGALGGSADPWRPGLGYVDFFFRPHLDNPGFPTSQEPALQAVLGQVDAPLRAVSDTAALIVAGDGRVGGVGSGRVLALSP